MTQLPLQLQQMPQAQGSGPPPSALGESTNRFRCSSIPCTEVKKDEGNPERKKKEKECQCHHLSGAVRTPLLDRSRWFVRGFPLPCISNPLVPYSRRVCKMCTRVYAGAAVRAYCTSGSNASESSNSGSSCGQFNRTACGPGLAKTKNDTAFEPCCSCSSGIPCVARCASCVVRPRHEPSIQKQTGTGHYFLSPKKGQRGGDG